MLRVVGERCTFLESGRENGGLEVVTTDGADLLEPVHKPAARATTFLNAPKFSADWVAGGMKHEGWRGEGVAGRVAMDKSELATKAVVITPSAASGAMVGPVKTASALLMLFASSMLSMASEMRRFPGARPLAKSSSTTWPKMRQERLDHVEDMGRRDGQNHDFIVMDGVFDAHGDFQAFSERFGRYFSLTSLFMMEA